MAGDAEGGTEDAAWPPSEGRDVAMTITDTVTIAGRVRTIERIILDGVVYYSCGILPLRARRDDLLRDIARTQGPEWRT